MHSTTNHHLTQFVVNQHDTDFPTKVITLVNWFVDFYIEFNMVHKLTDSEEIIVVVDVLYVSEKTMIFDSHVVLSLILEVVVDKDHI